MEVKFMTFKVDTPVFSEMDYRCPLQDFYGFEARMAGSFGGHTVSASIMHRPFKGNVTMTMDGEYHTEDEIEKFLKNELLKELLRVSGKSLVSVVGEKLHELGPCGWSVVKDGSTTGLATLDGRVDSMEGRIDWGD